MVHEVLKLKPMILYPTVNEVKSVGIEWLSDAYHTGVREVYGHSIVLTVLNIDVLKGEYYYPIIWTLHKQRSVTHPMVLK